MLWDKGPTATTGVEKYSPDICIQPKAGTQIHNLGLTEGVPNVAYVNCNLSFPAR